jgi:anti-anti-sigma regulatory factor
MHVVRLVPRDQAVLLHVSRHLQEEDVSMIEELIAKETDSVVLDLAEVTFVDREAARFLSACAVRGIGLRNCPAFIAFIRDWMPKM